MLLSSFRTELSPLREWRVGHKNCIAAYFFQIFHWIHSSALVGAERNDGLTAHVKMLEECEHCHGHCAPPVGISEEYGVVIVKAFGELLSSGLAPARSSAMASLSAFCVIFRVGFHRVDLKDYLPRLSE